MSHPSSPAMAATRAVILDIEGTTTSISFVYDVLFPYARKHLATFLADRFDDIEVQRDVAAMAPQRQADRDNADGAIALALALMDGDVKDTGLKGLQGKIWQAGYDDGQLLGHVFDDVPPALQRWQAAGVPVYIYSSGSVRAQKLLFGHSVAGDLLPLLSGHFDTTTGPKKQAESYRLIALAIAQATADVLFVTDNLAEAQAADAAGMQVAVSVRPGNAALPPHDFPVIAGFDALT